MRGQNPAHDVGGEFGKLQGIERHLRFQFVLGQTGGNRHQFQARQQSQDFLFVGGLQRRADNSFAFAAFQRRQLPRKHIAIDGDVAAALLGVADAFIRPEAGANGRRQTRLHGLVGRLGVVARHHPAKVRYRGGQYGS